MFSFSFDGILHSENIVHLAALFYLSGFLFRNAVLLRSLIVVGDIIYILYFYFAPDTPLWGGIFWSAMFMVVNVVMIAQILRERVHFKLTAEERRLFDMLGEFTPGQFRKVVRLARFEKAAIRKPITREGRALDRLYFVMDGNITIEKRRDRAFTGSGTFIGEDAFLLAGPTAASVTLEPGCRYFVWDAAHLRVLLGSDAALNTALMHVLNKKMVMKVMKASVMLDTVVPRGASSPLVP